MRIKCKTNMGHEPKGLKWLFRIIIISMTVFLINIFSNFNDISAQTFSEQVTERLRNRIEAAGIPPEISVQGEFIHASLMLPLFYERRIYRPAWSNRSGPIFQADTLIKCIKRAHYEGLRSEDYHLIKIESTLKKIRHYQNTEGLLDPSWLVDLDLLLTDAFLIYGSHLLAGRINPETIDPEWQAKHREEDLIKALQNALDSDRIEETLNEFLPQQLGYMKLRDMLVHYRDVAEKGGWPRLPDALKILKTLHKPPVINPCRRKLSKKNSRASVSKSHRRPIITPGGFIKTLKTFLKMTGDLDSEFTDGPHIYDKNLKQAVCRFQERHGLDVDGIIGPATLAEMNISAEERIHQIELNMERCRWLPHDFGQRYVLINIANYELEVVDNNKTALNMRVVVGKPYRRTPIFSENMTYLVFNPYWHVPATIASEDLLPMIQQDPEFFKKRSITVFRRHGKNLKEIDPTTLDWSTIEVIDSNLVFRQDPGPTNPLGRVKFIFPNKHEVYIHDTPSRGLFGKSERTFSSGCIRVENPIQLAEFVLQENQNWTKQDITAAVEQGEQQIVPLSRPIPVHLLYLTAWVDKSGTVHFRNDVYERDKPLLEALRKSPPDITNINRRWCHVIIIQPECEPSLINWPVNFFLDPGSFPFYGMKNPLSG